MTTIPVRSRVANINLVLRLCPLAPSLLAIQLRIIKYFNILQSYAIVNSWLAVILIWYKVL